MLTTCLRLDAQEDSGGRIGIANDGYWGIPVKPNLTYRASFYARSADHSGGALTVCIEGADGTVIAKGRVRKITDQWKRYAVTLKMPKEVKPSSDNRFVISPGKRGTYWFPLVSPIPPT